MKEEEGRYLDTFKSRMLPRQTARPPQFLFNKSFYARRHLRVQGFSYERNSEAFQKRLSCRVFARHAGGDGVKVEGEGGAASRLMHRPQTEESIRAGRTLHATAPSWQHS